MKKAFPLLFAAVALGLATQARASDTLASTSVSSWEFTSASKDVSQGRYCGAVFTLGTDVSNRYTITPDDNSLPSQVQLDSISFKTAETETTGSRYLYITDSNKNLIAVSDLVTLPAVDTDFTFTFSAVTNVWGDDVANTLTLNIGDTYYAYFASADTIQGLTMGENVGTGQYSSVYIDTGRSATYASSNATTWGLLNSADGSPTNATDNAPYIPNMTIVVSEVAPTPAVPEPATAALSLLALAGMAARRRRK